jgi:hypothetical protein
MSRDLRSLAFDEEAINATLDAIRAPVNTSLRFSVL